MATSAQRGLDTLLSFLQNNPSNFLGQDQFQGPFHTRTSGDLTAAVNFIGDAGDNIVRTGDSSNATQAGNDLLLGGDGNDFLAAGAGDDALFGGNGNDRLEADGGNDRVFGGAGDDQLFASQGDDFISGDAGNDTLEGEEGNDTLIGGDGVDIMKGGQGIDQFVYEGNVFANGTPAPAGQTGINALNKPDIILDYTIGEDKFAFDGKDLGLKNINFQKGQSSQVAGDANVIVLTDPFPAAGAAARAIANNPNITSHEGAFVYFNTTLGLTRLVYSNDLSEGGDISVLANLDNQRGAAGMANIANFSANDFTLV
ncbi:MAG: calcium-binding protein [Leptolyngbya sp. BL-A-14]